MSIKGKFDTSFVTNTVYWQVQRMSWVVATNFSGDRWMAWLATLLLFLFVGFIGTYFIPLREEIAGIEMQISVSAVDDSGEEKAPMHNASSESGDSLLESLPTVDERTVILNAMMDAASKHNLYIQQAQYHWLEKSVDAANSAGAVLPNVSNRKTIRGLQWVLPVEGAYRDIREYIGELLESNPSLALESISLGRDGPTGSRLDADLRLTLYLQASQ